jgi:hypothetical protein
MTPEAVILSPIHHPVAWVAFLAKWGGSALCVAFAFKLWSATSDRWWLLVGFAFLLPIAGYVVQCAQVGMLPLPLGYVESEHSSQSTRLSATFTRTLIVSYEWDITAPLVAAALEPV